MFVALDKAIRDRLEGNPRNRLGVPLNPTTNPGVRIPVFERTNSPERAGFDPFRVIPNRWKQVPVFNKTTDGREWEEVFPCVTFDLVSAEPRFEDWLPPYGKNRICARSEGASQDIFDAQGNLIASGQPTNVYQPLGDPFDLLYKVELHSKIEYEVYFMLRALNRVFPQRGYIVVDQADGSTSTLDMILQEGLSLEEEEPPAFESPTEQQGEYRYRNYSLTYLIEGYIDMTWDYDEITQVLVTSLELEMALKDLPNAEDVNSQEAVVSVIDLTTLM